MGFFTWVAVGAITSLILSAILILMARGKKRTYEVHLYADNDGHLVFERRAKGIIKEIDGRPKLLVKGERVPITFTHTSAIIPTIEKKFKPIIPIIKKEGALYVAKFEVDKDGLMNLKPIPWDYIDDLVEHLKRAEARKIKDIDRYVSYGIAIFALLLAGTIFIIAMQKASQIQNVADSVRVLADAIRNAVQTNQTIIIP